MAFRPKLLFLCQTLPYPLDSGVAIRSFNILRLLADAFDVTALCFFRNKPGLTEESVHNSLSVLGQLGAVEAFPIPQEGASVRFAWDHVRSVTTRRVYTTYAYQSNSYEARLREIAAVEEFDIVHMDSLDLARYLPRLPVDVPIICTHHNVESQLLRRRGDAERSIVRSWYLRHQADLMEKEERLQCPLIDLNVTVSETDRQTLSSLAPKGSYLVVPNGVDTAFFQDRGTSGADIIFIGGTNWFPNRDALEHFAEDILPVIRSRGVSEPVRWLGRSTPTEQREFMVKYGIELTGYLDDIRPHIQKAACCVVPLRTGGGTRLKIVTAWAAGKAVVSTSIGCEGLDAVDEVNILIRDTPEDFAEAVKRIIHDPTLRCRLEKNARQTAEQTYSWDVIGREMRRHYFASLNTNRRQLVAEQMHADPLRT